MKKCGGYKNVREGMLDRQVSALKGLRPLYEMCVQYSHSMQCFFSQNFIESIAIDSYRTFKK